jgi:hypothetical protein
MILANAAGRIRRTCIALVILASGASCAACRARQTPADTTLTVEPSAVSLQPLESVPFTARIGGNVTAGVTWTISEAAGGTIDSAGTYAAPATEGTYHVVATAGAGATATATVWVAAAAAKAGLGVNLDFLTDYSRQPFFADVVKQGRRWGSVAAPHDEGAAVDANGWPTQDAGIVLIVGDPQPGAAGTYKLSFTGQATIGASGQDPYPSVEISNVVYTSATNVTTADVTMSSAAKNLFLTFTGTRRTSSSAEGSGITNVKVIRPGHLSTDVFERRFSSRLAHFSTIRAMDYSRTNLNDEVEWADRNPGSYATNRFKVPPVSRPVGDLGPGAAWEWLILLANQTGKDLWINVPYGASDGYVTRLAQLLRYGSDGVNPYTSAQSAPVFPPLAVGRRVYVEHANELWNTGFVYSIRNHDDTVAEVAAGDPHHLGYTAGNDWEQAWRRVGYLAVRHSLIFRGVFGDADMMTRVRPVLATQLARYATTDQPLDYIRTVWGPGNTYGNPEQPVSYYLYALAGAPYVETLPADAGNGSMTVDDVFESMTTYAAESVYAWITANKAYADGAGIKLVAYEGGQHLLPSQGSAASKLAAQMDPRMRTVTFDLLQRWFDSGGDLFAYYELCTAWSQFGYWGLGTDIGSEYTPKWTGLKDFAATLP